jgi:pyruvate kinase
MQHTRQALNALTGQPAYLIAKLEREPAVAQAAAIAAHADALWLCRGDLGAEMGLAPMAAAVRRFSAGAGDYAVPVIMAGQVLEHMTGEPTPTRSEVCYLYDTLQSGYSGFVLSDETATGRYPVESVQAAAMFR